MSSFHLLARTRVQPSSKHLLILMWFLLLMTGVRGVCLCLWYEFLSNLLVFKKLRNINSCLRPHNTKQTKMIFFCRVSCLWFDCPIPRISRIVCIYSLFVFMLWIIWIFVVSALQNVQHIIKYIVLVYILAVNTVVRCDLVYSTFADLAVWRNIFATGQWPNGMR